MHCQKLLLAFVVAVLLCTGCEQQGDGQTPQPSISSGAPVQVQIFIAREQEVRQKNEVVGTVEAFQRAVISAKVTGTIAKLPVELGSTVNAGDLLVEIRAEEIAARLSQARTLWEQAKRNLEREQRLLAQNATAQEKVNILQDAFRVAESSLNEANILFSYTKIHAPFGGRVASKNSQAGDLAIAGAPILTLENDQKLQVVAAMPEELLGNLRIGETLTVRIPAAGEIPGQISEIAPNADASTRTVIVKLSIPTSPALRPGQFARVSLPGGPSTITLFIPEGAVHSFGQMERVFIAKDASAILRLVRTGSRRNGFVEILSGLSFGDQVILNSADLRDGQAIARLP